MTYKEQLRDKRWKAKQKQIKARDKGKCVLCGSTLNLHVHHLYYIPGLNAWEYEDEGLKTVCNLHHELLTFELPKLAGIIAFEILMKQFNL